MSVEAHGGLRVDASIATGDGGTSSQRTSGLSDAMLAFAGIVSPSGVIARCDMDGKGDGKAFAIYSSEESSLATLECQLWQIE